MRRLAAALLLGALVWGSFAATGHSAEVGMLELALQTRDSDGKPIISHEKIVPARIGVVVVDMWNFHWCKTATMRVDALVPRMNKALDAARDLGMTVMLCPSDV